MRIIPARAGFTPPTVHSTCPSYGSSPLARGLPGVPADQRGRPRIIPARAGFTWRPCRSAWTTADHPRSRGVYVTVPVVLSMLVGSSPLARGLLIRRGPAPAVGRIIPARAGFTMLLPAGRVRMRDHPRSRGVYTVEARSRAAAAGSSPLARGLREVLDLGCGGEGIIPARAGFTGLS